MGNNAIQDDMKIEGFGSISPPPDLSTILQKLAAAAEGKLSLELTPNESRVLHNFVEGF